MWERDRTEKSISGMNEAKVEINKEGLGLSLVVCHKVHLLVDFLDLQIIA